MCDKCERDGDTAEPAVLKNILSAFKHEYDGEASREDQIRSLATRILTINGIVLGLVIAFGTDVLPGIDIIYKLNLHDSMITELAKFKIFVYEFIMFFLYALSLLFLFISSSYCILLLRVQKANEKSFFELNKSCNYNISCERLVIRTLMDNYQANTEAINKYIKETLRPQLKNLIRYFRIALLLVMITGISGHSLRIIAQYY